MNRLLARQMNLKERNGTGKAPSLERRGAGGGEGGFGATRPMDAIDGA